MRAEILIDRDMRVRGKRMIAALIASAPIPVVVSEKYTGSCDLLVTYGTGHPIRRPWWDEHRRSGRHCIGWDLGYWDGMRATIDDDHPTAWIRPEPVDRWDAQKRALRSDADPKGYALIVGMGKKSLPVWNLRPLEWETAAVRRAEAAGYITVFRPKSADYPRPSHVHTVYGGTIEKALRGAAIVYCRHSNVAVDACIAGVPVVCESGAAYSLYKDNPSPTIEQRLAFLRSLAWWNYKPEEAGLAWSYLISRIQHG